MKRAALVSALVALLVAGSVATAQYSITTFQTFISSSSPPTCAVSTAAGTGATCSILANSTQTAGEVAVTTGTVPLAAGAKLVTVTLTGATFQPNAICYIGPDNAATAPLLGSVAAYAPRANTTSNSFDILIAGVTGLTGSTTYQWKYFCVGARSM